MVGTRTACEPNEGDEMDEVLRQLLQDDRNPIERIAPDQSRCWSGWFTNQETLAAHYLKTGKRLVVLACGHYTLTAALQRAACPRCGEMIRSGYDYDGFRWRGVRDGFSWANDPLRSFNEGDRPDGESAIKRLGPI